MLAVPAVDAAAPVVDSFAASSATVLPGGSVTLTVDAHDPDCTGACTSGCGLYIRSDLTQWSASGGGFLSQDNGTSASPYTATAVWGAPATEGTYSITVTLADSGSFLCGGRQTTSASQVIQVTTSTNQPPTIQSLTAAPALVFPGEMSNVQCIASDPEGDPLTFSWSADSGTVAPGSQSGNTAHATFTASVPGIATITCTATDAAGGFGSDSVGVSVSGAQGEKALDEVLVSPQRIAADSWGNLYVVDRKLGGIAVVNLLSGELVYQLPLVGVSSVAVDWADNLLLGGRLGAEVRTRAGSRILDLYSGAPLGDVSDVAVDSLNQRYGVLHRSAARVVVYDSAGVVQTAFGTTGDGSDQFKSPQGLAVTSAGEWVVADSGHGKIKIFDATGNFSSSFGDLGGGAGEFIQLDDVAVDAAGIFYASDTFQSWVQAFNPNGSPRETLGSYGDQVGKFQTPTGVAVVEGMERLLVASLNSSSVQVFVTSGQAPVVGPEPEGSLSTTSLAFASQAVGSVSDPQSFSLTNVGSAQLGIRRVVVNGEFMQTSSCGTFLDPGDSCSFDIRFAPTLEGAATGSMTIDTSAPSGSLAVGFTGSAFVPESVMLSKHSLVFGDQAVGTLSQPQTVTLSNPGTAPLLISSIGIAGDFVQANTCPATLAGGAACSIEVRFAPQTVGDFLLGTVAIDSSAAGSPYVIQLQGSGVAGWTLLAIDDVTVDESRTAASFRVRLSVPSDGSVSVEAVTRADTAAEGEDYRPIATVLRFGAGTTEQFLDVDLNDDPVLEPDEETFFVELVNPVNATVQDGEAIGTILDDEVCPGPNLLTNPSAEMVAVGGEIPGWSQVAGQSWWIGVEPPDPVDGEAYFGAGGAVLADLYQDVDVAAFARAIDADQQRFRLQGWIQSATDGVPDEGWIEVEYRDALGIVIGADGTARVVSPGIWQAVMDTLQPPPGTRTVRVHLLAEQITGPETDVWFDALELHSLRTPTVVVADAVQYEGDSGTVESPFVVRLACAYWQPVTVDYATADGTALVGEDYLAVGGTLTLPTGTTEDRISVSIMGDEVDEGHEDFALDLVLIDPAEAVLLDDRALGLIVNDDFCPLGVGCWKTNRDGWPVDQLVLGGALYDRSALDSLLGYRGNDGAAKLARQLVATLFNLEMGSDPAVWPLVQEADHFLTIHPPGSRPAGGDAGEAERLKDLLEIYNDGSCPPS